MQNLPCSDNLYWVYCLENGQRALQDTQKEIENRHRDDQQAMQPSDLIKDWTHPGTSNHNIHEQAAHLPDELLYMVQALTGKFQHAYMHLMA